MFPPKRIPSVQRELGELAVPVVSGHRPSVRVIDPETREEALAKARWLLNQFRKACRQNDRPKPNKSGRQPLKPKHRIILLDDDETILQVTERAITHGIRDVEVHSFQDAVAAWHELLQEPPDVLIMDFYHSAPDGEAIIRMLAEQRASFPILVISGGATEEQVRRSVSPYQKVSFLRKPWSQKQLYGELSKCLREPLAEPRLQSPPQRAIQTPENTGTGRDTRPRMTPGEIEIIKAQRLHKVRLLEALHNQKPMTTEEMRAQVQRSLATNRPVQKKPS